MSDCCNMLNAMVVMIMLIVRCVAGEVGSCPDLPGQLGDPLDLDISGLSLTVQPEDLSFLVTVVNLVKDGVASPPFNTYEALSSYLNVIITFLPTSLTFVPIRTSLAEGRGNGGRQGALYYSMSVRSLNESVAPAGCPAAALGVIQPIPNNSLALSLSCSAEGVAIYMVCLTVGTEPFSLLNGTYHTITFFFPHRCTLPSPKRSECNLRPSSTILAEMCITPSQSRELVEAGEGSWSFFPRILAKNNTLDAEGYCIIHEDYGPSGLHFLLQEESIYLHYAIPAQFETLSLYFKISRSITLVPMSYTVFPYTDNTTVMDHPFVKEGARPEGVTYTGRLDFVLDLTCKSPGIARVYPNISIGLLIDGTIYNNMHSELYFYRNCTDNSTGTGVIFNKHDATILGLKVGVPLSITFILLMAITLSSFVIIFILTKRYRQNEQDLALEHQLQSLSSSTAYFMQNFEDQMDFLKDTSLEYNHASLEMVGKLGEGAFSMVFKARAPGLQCEGWQENDIVAVKILKEEMESDALQAFMSEVKISSKFQHRNVVKLIGVCTKTPEKCMIFEYMDLGNLKNVLRQSDPHKTGKSSPTSPSSSLDCASGSVILTPAHFLPCCLQVAQGLRYLASLKFVHRDIATRNCLINHQLVIKIADFGMSRDISTWDYYRIGSSNACIPVRWMSPEALFYGKYTVKSDVWSFGVLMWEVYTYALQPYGGTSDHEVINKIKNGHLLHCPDLCPASIYDIMKACWMYAPHPRPHITELLSRISNLLQISRLDPQDGYVPMQEARESCYSNLTFGVEVEESELREKRRVDKMLQPLKGKQEEEEKRGGEGAEGTLEEDSEYDYVDIKNGLAYICGRSPMLVKREENPVDRDEEAMVDDEHDKENLSDMVMEGYSTWIDGELLEREEPAQFSYLY